MQYYVYALIDPRDNRPFYIGKGKDKRVQKHFKDAEHVPNAITLSEISEDEFKELEKFGNIEKLAKIRNLFDDGYGFEDIARILAKGLDEESAFTIESFLIKSMYGIDNLTNRVVGKYSDRFRPYDSWELLKGYDVHLITDHKNESRINKYNAMIAEKLDKPLKAIVNAFPNLKFDEPKVLDAGELGIEADVAGTRIKIAVRRKNLYCELRGRNIKQHEWIENHFIMLNKSELLRKDHVFLPKCWRKENMTDDVEVMIERVRLMIDLCMLESNHNISDDIAMLLK